jgi:hypothetical protein
MFLQLNRVQAAHHPSLPFDQHEGRGRGQFVFRLILLMYTFNATSALTLTSLCFLPIMT